MSYGKLIRLNHNQVLAAEKAKATKELNKKAQKIFQLLVQAHEPEVWQRVMSTGKPQYAFAVDFHHGEYWQPTSDFVNLKDFIEAYAYKEKPIKTQVNRLLAQAFGLEIRQNEAHYRSDCKIAQHKTEYDNWHPSELVFIAADVQGEPD